jgi:uncharacterized integral membrane protein
MGGQTAMTTQLWVASVKTQIRDARWLIGAVIVALVIALILLRLAWINVWDRDRNGLWGEVGKAGIQIIVVAVIGTLVTFALKTLEDHRDELRRRSEYRLDLLRRLQAAYETIKAVRRQLEAAGFGIPSTTSLGPAVASIYRAEMTRLLNARLAIESIRDELEPGLGGNEATKLIWCHLDALQHHLNYGVLQEYQIQAPDLIRDPNSRKYNQFPQLRNFVTDANKSFKADLSCPYHIAACALATDILNPGVGLNQILKECEKSDPHKKYKEHCEMQTTQLRVKQVCKPLVP